MIEWSDWQPVYLDIVHRLGLDSKADYEATALLTHLLRNTDPSPYLHGLDESIRGKIVVVFGAGPSLEKHLTKVTTSTKYSEVVFVAVDGATSAFIEQGINCDLIITDLDGNLDDIELMSKRGALPIVHAHGDNMETVRDFVPRLEHVLGSTQVEPTQRAFLWGGFTDGDRACHLVESYAPQGIVLAGMDFGDVVGRWSKPHYDNDLKADPRKQLKLEIGRELLSSLISASSVDFDFIQSSQA